MPTQTAYAVYSAKEKAKSSVSDFKRGMVQEQQSRQTGRLEKQEQRRQNIADKRMELQKAQEARQHSERLTDQRQRELPVPMSDQPQLQPFQSRVWKKCRKSNALPQRPLQSK
ncbi:hypothetical protein QSM_0570 [Clostridioides difficile P30]|nr:hypothetical protein QSM_0570 [Clostridioides difficile P30]